jgi:peptidyl-prolyl cis-trans isomerase D
MQVAQDLGMFQLIGGLAGDARTMDALQPNFIFGTYVLRHEAEKLGINPTSAEITDTIKKLPPFQTSGQFDFSKYNAYTQRLGSLGFTSEQVEEIVADSLRLEKLKALLGATISAAPSEVRTAFEEINQKQEVSFVRIKEEDVAKEINVTDEDVKKAFEERKETLKTDDLRKVKAVSFLLTEEEKTKLQGRERGAALQRLMEQATEFSAGTAEKGAKLEDLAQKAGRPVVETPEFPMSKPPKELNESFAAAEAAFDPALTLEQPFSDLIKSDKNDGYYILQLTSITPPRPKTFEEAKADLAETLKRERTAELLTKRATEVRTKLEAELKGGKTFAEAAQAAGVTAETLPAFSRAEPGDSTAPGANEIRRAATELAVGELSEPIPTKGGRIICRVERRLPLDETKFAADKQNLADRIAEDRTDNAFRMWMSERMKAANVQLPSRA